MNAIGSASCGAFRRHPCRRPRTFWHCPKGSWTSQRLAFLYSDHEAYAASSSGSRWSPASSGLAQAESAVANSGQGPAPPPQLIDPRSAWLAQGYRVGDETRRNHHIPHHDSPRQEPRAGDLGAARLWLWATSPLSYVSDPPAHPVELRARRGSCRLGPTSGEKSNTDSWSKLLAMLAPAASRRAASALRSCRNTGEISHV